MKEGSPIRKIMIVGATALALAACDKPDLPNGIVYEKEPMPKSSAFFVARGIGGEFRYDDYRIKIAQCPTPEPLPFEKIEEECKVVPVAVAPLIYSSVQVGQRVSSDQLEFHMHPHYRVNSAQSTK